MGAKNKINDDMLDAVNGGGNVEDKYGRKVAHKVDGRGGVQEKDNIVDNVQRNSAAPKTGKGKKTVTLR